MYRFNMPANGRTVLRRLIDAVAYKKKKTTKETQLRTKEKKCITTPYTISILYFNTFITLIFYTLRLKF